MSKLKIERIDVRYQPSRHTIKSKMANHFKNYKTDLEKRGGIVDVKKLVTFMGISMHRWKEITEYNQPVLLCEAAAYADYMLADINDLYENLPYSLKPKK